MTEKGTLELRIDQSFMACNAPMPISATAYIHGQVWEVQAQIWQSQINFSLRCNGGDDDKSWNGPGSLPVGPISSGYLPSGPIPSNFLPAGHLPSGSMPLGPMSSGSMPSGPTPSGPMPSGNLTAGQKRSAKMMVSHSVPAGSMQFPVMTPAMPYQQAQNQMLFQNPNLQCSVSASATASLHIVSQKDGVDDIVSHKVDNFSNVQWSQLESIRSDVLLNPDNGFIKDDTVIVRVHVTAEMPQGVENAKSKEFISSISTPPDGVLIVGVLSFYSDYFKTLFGEDEIVLEEVGYEEMLELLSVIYPSNAPITEKNINTILKLASRFKMPSVLERCKKELKISTNISGALKLLLAQRYNFSDLQIQLSQQYKTIHDVSKLKMEPEYKLLNSNTLALLFNSIGSGYQGIHYPGKTMG
ncbi:BTB/POZ domain-containing protein [Ditylenchus destructor]|nr:BTB/POZ domain-containing protein [Ditylenchus destructor]